MRKKVSSMNDSSWIAIMVTLFQSLVGLRE